MINSDKINANSWFVVVNPSSGTTKFSKKWKLALNLLDFYQFDFNYAFTKTAKDEITLTQNAIKNGYKNIIAVGGDGTLHHVVNGIMLQMYEKTSNITIGVIPIGTGNDWIKTYNIPNDIAKAIKIISQKKTVLQDIGLLKFNAKTVYFNNVAGMGYDAFVVKKLKFFKKIGSLSYTFAGLFGMFQYKKSEFTLLINQQTIKTNCLLTVFGIGKFSGGGMQFTKEVNPTDSLLDITIVSNFTLWDLIVNLPKLYNGKIVNHKKVQTVKTSSLEIIPSNPETYFQADGELLGKGRLKVSIIPKAISFVIS